MKVTTPKGQTVEVCPECGCPVAHNLWPNHCEHGHPWENHDATVKRMFKAEARAMLFDRGKEVEDFLRHGHEDVIWLLTLCNEQYSEIERLRDAALGGWR